MPADDTVDPTPGPRFSSIPHLLKHRAEGSADALAILAPGRAPLSYGGLYRHVDRTRRSLRAMGITRRDRIAVMLPNGPEMAVAILTVAACAACAPMNPAYGADEVDRYFADLRPGALITMAGRESPACRVAVSRGIRVVELSADRDGKAGLFTLTAACGEAAPDEPVTPGDVALLLLTSGTTSRAKIVPLTHENICTSAYASATALALGETDRCLNVLPLFHGHGLIATVLASLSAGASVVCTPGCDVNSFFAWLRTFRPSWYSAVPTMHQAILAQARRDRDAPMDCRLRLIRSASASLPPRVLAELERTFDTIVIEFYGMTETASSPIACNPLPQRRRKPGSVGVPIGLDVAIMDEAGALLPGGRTGQVMVRGASVMAGYQGDPTANRLAFAGDWFKTGDLGFFDDDGYLFLTGRSVEIINRGGENIAPREVDEALLEHPEVAEAVTFAVPHPTLGEEVAAAVVLRPGAAATAKDIRRFVRGRLADFKVPRQVLVVDELPKGPTGKVQRSGLAAQLHGPHGLSALQTFVAPRTPVEEMLARCWADVLQVEEVGIHDDFFGLGGDSLLATRVLARIHDTLRLTVEGSRFFEAPTVAEMARYLEKLSQADKAERPASAIGRAPRDDRLPASVAQERLFQLQRALPRLPFFNILCALRLTSAIDAAVLQRSLDEIVRRHEILRTTFAVLDGQCVQLVAPHATVQLTFDDLSSLSPSRTATAGRRVIEEEALHSFDLARGPLFRARLVRLAGPEQLLLLGMHRIIVDGWSLGMLVDELFALYDAFSAERASPLPSPSIQFADFAYWQRHWRSHPDVVAQLAYWREQLRDPLPVIELAAARTTSAIDGLHTARREFALPLRLADAARNLAHREGGTLFMALVAALMILLHRYVHQDDMRVATLVANRNRPGAGELIGPLANTVILRTDLGGDPSFRDVLRRVRATALAAFAHQDLPFEELVDTLVRERALRPGALAQVMIALHNMTARPGPDPTNMRSFEEVGPAMAVPLVRATTCDISLLLREGENGVSGSCIYKPRLFDSSTIARFLRDFRTVLGYMVSDPERRIATIKGAAGQQPNNRRQDA